MDELFRWSFVQWCDDVFFGISTLVGYCSNGIPGRVVLQMFSLIVQLPKKLLFWWYVLTGKLVSNKKLILWFNVKCEDSNVIITGIKIINNAVVYRKYFSYFACDWKSSSAGVLILVPSWESDIGVLMQNKILLSLGIKYKV